MPVSALTFAAALMETILARLTPLLITAACSDPDAARLAAQQLLLSRQPQTDAELTLCAEIVSFSLHALDALGQSADPELPLTRKLRLRGSAVSLSREAHKAERKLDQLQKLRTKAQEAVQEADVRLPVVEPALAAPPASASAQTDPKLTWTQAYHQRQRDRALAKSRARAAERQAKAAERANEAA
jgi:hypothetical protein